jgi:hypothetical protein
MTRRDLPPEVLARRAIVYVRQSTGVQVQENLESQRRQYELVALAKTYGFADVAVIDDDLGRSASGLVERPHDLPGNRGVWSACANGQARPDSMHRVAQPA